MRLIAKPLVWAVTAPAYALIWALIGLGRLIEAKPPHQERHL